MQYSVPDSEPVPHTVPRSHTDATPDSDAGDTAADGGAPARTG
jgi:hypothetical protein